MHKSLSLRHGKSSGERDAVEQGKTMESKTSENEAGKP